MWLTSWREVALAAALAAIAFQTGETWAIGASILFWSVGVILTTGAVLTLLAAGRLIRLGAQSLKMI